MSIDKPTILLREADVEPTEKVLKTALGVQLFEVYAELMQIAETKFGLNHEWRFYRDGKTWLCKVIYKKKTVFWLSMWDSCIKTSFYFMRKTRAGIFDLEISADLKENFANTKIEGRLIPLVLDINQKEQLKDLQEIITYKKSLK